MRTIGITQFLERKFDTYPLDGAWGNALGEVEKNFKMILFGKPGNGKTEFAIQMARYFARFTKVYYNSFEQGISKTLQDALRRNNMQDVVGKVIFGDKETFEEMMQRLGGKNAPQIVIIDSRDYLNLTGAQYKTLTEAHPRKAFVIICWESAGKPKGEHAKAIEYMCDIKCYVRNFIMEPRSRYGGNEKFVIWDRKQGSGSQLKLL
jgi:hypothetical protein